jgi:hypothetical protein
MSNAGDSKFAITGEITIIPIIERQMLPRSINPFSNSFPRPRRFPQMRSRAPSKEKTSIISDIIFILPFLNFNGLEA